MPILLLAVLFISNLTFGQAEDDKFLCNPPEQGWGMKRVGQWAEDMDTLGNVALHDPEIGDMKTVFGNPVDISCYHGLKPADWRKRLQRMEAGLDYAMTQAQRCWSTLGLGGASDIVTTLRRTKINCSKDPTLAAVADMGGLRSPNYSHNYELTDWGPYMDNSPMESVGSSLFHEASHWSVSNNRGFHNHTKTRKRAGCDKSLYEDRIYLMEAACFPMSDVGQEFYHPTKGANNCADVCFKALTETDTDAIDWIQRKFQSGSQSLYGHKVKPDEARIICDRIKNIPGNLKESQNKKKELEKRGNLLSTWADKNFGKSESGKHLQDLAKDAFLTASNAYDPSSNLSGIQKIFKDKKESFISEVRKVCAGGADSAYLLSFCKIYTPEKNPMIDEMEKMERQIKEVKVSDFNLYTPAPDAKHEVKLYSP